MEVVNLVQSASHTVHEINLVAELSEVTRDANESESRYCLVVEGPDPGYQGRRARVTCGARLARYQLCGPGRTDVPEDPPALPRALVKQNDRHRLGHNPEVLKDRAG